MTSTRTQTHPEDQEQLEYLLDRLNYAEYDLAQAQKKFQYAERVLTEAYIKRNAAYNEYETLRSALQGMTNGQYQIAGERK